MCCSPLNVFGTHFALLGMTLACLWLPRMLLGFFGAPRATKNLYLDFGLPLAPLGCHWAALGHLGLPRGASGGFGSKMEAFAIPAHKK